MSLPTSAGSTDCADATLAIHGGPQQVPEDLRVFRHPRICKTDREAVLRQLDESISLYGKDGIYDRLESAIRSRWGLAHVLSVNSGTSALYSLYYSLGLKPGDEVIAPAYTFFATATPLVHLGLRVVLADAGQDGNLDPVDVAQRISARTRAIVATHMWGIPCRLDRLSALAAAHNLMLLEDASHAHGARFMGAVVGSQSDGAAWSLQGRKLLTGGEGGLLATRHEEMFQRAVLLGHYNVRARDQVSLSHLIPLAPTGTGLNLRMHPLAAALALSQLGSLDTQLVHRREVAQLLTDGISSIPGLSTPAIPEMSEPAWYAFPILYDTSAFPGLSKQRFVEAIHAEGAVDADIPRSTCPLTAYALFASSHPHADSTLPGALSFHRRLFKLPVWYGERRFDYANAYLSAIRKVAAQRRALAASTAS